MQIRFPVAAMAGCLALAAASQAGAVSVVGATKVRVTSAIPSYIQVSELEAYEFGTLANVAAAANGGTASASSVYDAGFEAAKAIDGDNLSTLFISAGFEAGEYLDIFFSHATTLTQLSIYGRSGCCTDRDIFNVQVFNRTGDVLYSGQLDARATRSATVQFDDPPVTGGVPEPATWALMVLGFGAAGALLRGRRFAI